jgi:hypothetical protein
MAPRTSTDEQKQQQFDNYGDSSLPFTTAPMLDGIVIIDKTMVSDHTPYAHKSCLSNGSRRNKPGSVNAGVYASWT